VRRNTVYGRRDFIKISTIKGMGTGRGVQFAGEMNIIKYIILKQYEECYPI